MRAVIEEIVQKWRDIEPPYDAELAEQLRVDLFTLADIALMLADEVGR
jgi:hypothetical protein